MKTVLQIIEGAGGLATFTWTRIENPPFMLLVIESLGEPGPNGHRALSIAHYGEQNGDAMRDPEICAEVVVENGAAKLWPYYFRNDYAGVILCLSRHGCGQGRAGSFRSFPLSLARRIAAPYNE